MSSSRIPDRPALYTAAERFVDEGLRKDGSLFNPDRRVWRIDVIADFRERFVEEGDLGEGSFVDKLRKQLRGAQPDVAQFVAELLFVHCLATVNMKGSTVEALIDTALKSAPGTTPIPEDLRPALEVGMASTGAGFLALRYWMVRFLFEFVRAWKTKLTGHERQRLLDDPWAFREFVFRLEMKKAQTQRAALLHLVHPDTFEAVVSERHKEMIVATYDAALANEGENADRRLARIRPMVAERYGADFNYYRPNVMSEWSGAPRDPWKQLAKWIRRFVSWEGFDANERDYKLEFAKAMSEYRTNLDGGELHPRVVIDTLRNTNLVSWRVVANLASWADSKPDEFRSALRALWAGDDPVERRIDRFVELTGDATVGAPVRLAAALLLPVDPANYPPYAQETLRKAYAVTRFDPPWKDATGGQQYAHALAFFDRVLEEARREGVKLRDRLDAQSAVWAVLKYQPNSDPLSSWTEGDRIALERFRDGLVDGGDGDNDEPEPPPPPRPLASLAEELLLEESFLTSIYRLLEAKRQVIFYGPPGTGKTYVARRLAQTVAGGDRVRLVQLHPSYTYEDFVEGFRPTFAEGASGFSLIDGALKRIAHVAASDPSHTYVLIVDELNRGNVAKVFGELYFLLEYRGESMDLQYSREPFRLPANLWFIGTVNTADRSIALMDAALRRRFYFVPFFPDQEPIRGLLGRWLRREKPALVWVADVLEEANARLADPHFSIGPSHFMRPDLDEEWVQLIWRHSILPTLQEHFFGRETELERFTLAALTTGASAVTNESLDNSKGFGVASDEDDATAHAS